MKEFDWIDRIRARFAPLVPPGTVGIGDDGAVIPLGGGRSIVVTADMLIEDVHFVQAMIAGKDLGYKSLAVNLSDLAAMGARPLGSFLSIGLPKDVDVAWREGFLSGYQALSEKFNVPLLGGDTTAADRITVSVTALGTAQNEHIKRRNAARPGDVICVAGTLGDSAAGFLLQGRTPENNGETKLISAHQHPEPQVDEGLWLAARGEVHAMMDISDGIASDLLHILKESNVSACVELENLPLSPELRQAAGEYGWNAEKLAVSGGEDYVLLLTAEPVAFAYLNQHFTSEFGTKLYPIGEILPGPPTIEWRRGGVVQHVDYKGYTHF